MIRPQYTTTKNRSIIGWQIKSDWFTTPDLGFTLLPPVCICTVSVVVYIVVRLYYLWAFTNPLVAKVIYFQKRVDSLLSLSPMIFPIRYVFCVRVLYQLNFADRWTPPICQLFVKCYSPFHSKSLYYTGRIDKNWEFELWKMRISQYVSALLLG